MNDEDAAVPQVSDFALTADFIVAHERFHDQRQPTPSATLERAIRLADECMRGIDLQLRRISGIEPEDAEWLFRIWLDIQFLIICLWRLRLAAKMAGDSEEVRTAIAQFDQQVPDLAMMRHVAQHLDE